VKQQFAFRFLAPTFLVSLLLVAACVGGSLYLNRLHLNAAEELSENVQSTLAAARLEATARELVRLFRFRSDNPNAPRFHTHVAEMNANARQLLEEAEGLANLEREGVLVRQITYGFKKYFREWDRRADVSTPNLAAHDANLADLLDREVVAPCVELRKFNLGQVEQSDQFNHRVVATIRWGLLLVAVGAPIAGLLLGYRMARQLHHSIWQLSVRIRDAHGKLNRELGSVTVQEEGDLGTLHQQMQGMIEEIGRVVDQLQQREHQVLRGEHLADVGRIASGVAHELRNPLTSIKMFVQAGLEGDPPAGLPSEDLALLEQEIRRMEQYLQTFLDFARPPRSQRRRCDLKVLVHRAVALVEGRARKQNVAIAVELAAAPVAAIVDPDQVNQVLVNLLLNAVDALPTGGEVRVEVPRAYAGSVELRVRDNGPGVPPSLRETLFEPFASGKENGLGLGLSICKQLVEAHGGTIRAEANLGGGALFVINLPGAEVTKENEPSKQTTNVE
jgi:signal transduction histidine kinase